MKKKNLKLNKIKIANLNQVELQNINGGASSWICSAITSWAVGKIIDLLSTANMESNCTNTLNPTDDCGSDFCNYSQDPTCTVSVCDNI